MGLRVAVGALLGPEAAGAWPWDTLVVNLAGSLCLAILVARVASRATTPAIVEAFLAPGLLASFTTYSTFAVETNRLITQRPLVAMLYAVVSVAGGVTAARFGLAAGRR